MYSMISTSWQVIPLSDPEVGLMSSALRQAETNKSDSTTLHEALLKTQAAVVQPAHGDSPGSSSGIQVRPAGVLQGAAAVAMPSLAGWMMKQGSLFRR